MQIYAHRGASQTYPENTLEAFAEAVRLGVDGVELDVHVSSDGVAVITHDASLSRAFGLDIDVRERTFAELRRVAPALPSFAEVLDLIGSNLHVDIEVKQPGVEESVLAVLGKFPAARWSISCFEWPVLERFRALNGACDLWLLSSFVTPDLFATASRLSASAVALDQPIIREETVEAAHRAGLKVMAWTVNDPRRARQLEQWGLDMLCTDAPQQFVR